MNSYIALFGIIVVGFVVYLALRDKIFGEDPSSSFEKIYTIEMYIQSYKGFDGTDMISQFGIEIRDKISLLLARKRFKEEVTTYDDTIIRPREGDLIYFPLSKSLFDPSMTLDDDSISVKRVVMKQAFKEIINNSPQIKIFRSEKFIDKVKEEFAKESAFMKIWKLNSAKILLIPMLIFSGVVGIGPVCFGIIFSTVMSLLTVPEEYYDSKYYPGYVK